MFDAPQTSNSRPRTGSLLAILAIVSIAALSGCGTPPEIKQLSTEQLRAQHVIRASLDDSFSRMEAVVAAQVEQIETMVVESNKESLVAGGELLSKPNGTLTPKALAERMVVEIAARQKIVAGAREKLAQLQEAHRNVLKAQDKVIEAQTVLDRYLQLEQTDEKIANQLLAAVGFERGQLQQSMDAGLKAFSDVNGMLESLSKP